MARCLSACGPLSPHTTDQGADGQQKFLPLLEAGVPHWGCQDGGILGKAFFQAVDFSRCPHVVGGRRELYWVSPTSTDSPGSRGLHLHSLITPRRTPKGSRVPPSLPVPLSPLCLPLNNSCHLRLKPTTWVHSADQEPCGTIS